MSRLNPITDAEIERAIDDSADWRSWAEDEEWGPSEAWEPTEAEWDQNRQESAADSLAEARAGRRGYQY